MHTLVTLIPKLDEMNIEALLLGASALAIVYLTPQKISRYIPTPLLALVVLTVVSLLLDLDVQKIGDIPSGLPSLVMPDFDLKLYSTVISLAFTLAIWVMLWDRWPLAILYTQPSFRPISFRWHSGC